MISRRNRTHRRRTLRRAQRGPSRRAQRGPSRRAQRGPSRRAQRGPSRRAQRGPSRRAQRGGASYTGDVFSDIYRIINLEMLRAYKPRRTIRGIDLTDKNFNELKAKVLEFIEQATADQINAVNEHGRTMLNALLEAIANQNITDRVHPDNDACINPLRTELLNALLRKNPDYNIRNKKGELPIHYAFRCKPIFMILIDHIERTINDPNRMSAYVNETMSTTGPGAAPLIFEAASSETDAILKKLLAYGADPNTIATIDGVNYTPLKYSLARMNGYIQPNYNIPLLLLEHGAHTLDSDNPDSLLIQMLRYSNFVISTPEIVNLMVTMIERIIQANPSPLTMHSVTGETPYMIALKSPYDEIRNIFTVERIAHILEGMDDSARAILDKYKDTVQLPRPNIYGWTPEKILRMKSRNAK
jgi:hypothetical protein